MASVLTQIQPFHTSTGTTCPVILKGREGIDYILKKFKTKASANIKMRWLVKIDSTNTDIVDVNGAGEIPLGIVPDTVDNRKAMAAQNDGVWDYATAFDDATWIDVAIPINNIVVSAILAASNAINEGLQAKAAASGCVALMATTTVRDSAGTGTTAITESIQVGKFFAKTTSGTGTNIVPMVLFA